MELFEAIAAPGDGVDFEAGRRQLFDRRRANAAGGAGNDGCSVGEGMFLGQNFLTFTLIGARIALSLGNFLLFLGLRSNDVKGIF
jgi:hypothetical protein